MPRSAFDRTPSSLACMVELLLKHPHASPTLLGAAQSWKSFFRYLAKRPSICSRSPFIVASSTKSAVMTPSVMLFTESTFSVGST